VLLEVSRYTTVVFTPDDSIRNVRVGGYFRAGDVDSLLVALRTGFDIDSQRTADGRIALFPAAAPR
jgi:transmembrane sensor